MGAPVHLPDVEYRKNSHGLGDGQLMKIAHLGWDSN